MIQEQATNQAAGTAAPPLVSEELSAPWLEVREENQLLDQTWRDEWEALAQSSDTNTINQTFEWNHHWWNCLGDDRSLLVLTVWRGNERIAIIPLMRSRTRLCFRNIRYWEFLSTRQGDYLDVICAAENKPDAIDAFLGYLHAHRAEWDLVHLKQIPDYSATLPRLWERADLLGFRSLRATSALCPTYVFSGDPKRDKQFGNRKSLRQGLNGLRRLGPVEFEVIETPEALTKHLEDFFEMHVLRRELTTSKSSLRRENNRNFFRGLTPDLARLGRAKLFALRLNDEVIAYEYSFDYGRVFTMYKPAYALEYSRYSPGNLLTKFEFEWAADHGMSEVDMTVGDEPYKFRFSNHTRENREVLITNELSCYAALRFDRWCAQLNRALRDRLAQTPAGEKLRAWYRRVMLSSSQAALKKLLPVLWVVFGSLQFIQSLDIDFDF